MRGDRKRTSVESTILRIAPLLFAVAVGAGVVTLTASCEETGPSPIGNHPDDSGVDAAADAKSDVASEASTGGDGGEEETDGAADGSKDTGTDAADAATDAPEDG